MLVIFSHGQPLRMLHYTIARCYSWMIDFPHSLFGRLCELWGDSDLRDVVSFSPDWPQLLCYPCLTSNSTLHYPSNLAMDFQVRAEAKLEILKD